MPQSLVTSISELRLTRLSDAGLHRALFAQHQIDEDLRNLSKVKRRVESRIWEGNSDPMEDMLVDAPPPSKKRKRYVVKRYMRVSLSPTSVGLRVLLHG